MRITQERRAQLHVWLGEYALAQTEDLDGALWHFRQVRRLVPPSDPRHGRAAYDTAIVYRTGRRRRRSHGY